MSNLGTKVSSSSLERCRRCVRACNERNVTSSKTNSTRYFLSVLLTLYCNGSLATRLCLLLVLQKQAIIETSRKEEKRIGSLKKKQSRRN